MVDDGHDLNARLAGIDLPRDLPSDLASDLVARLLDPVAPREAAAPDSLQGADRARPVPIVVARRVNEAILAVTPAHGGRFVVGPRSRAVGVAAVLLLLVGALAAISKSAPDGHDTALSRAGVGPFAPWPSFIAPPADTVPDTVPEARVQALSESDPAYARLEPFGSCQELLDWVRPRAEALTDHHGLEGAWHGSSGGGGGGMGRTSGSSTPADLVADAGASADGGPSGRSGTNVIEPGVDEPDEMKITDRAMVVLHSSPAGQKSLRVLDIRGGGATLAATVPLPVQARSLLLHEQTIVVLVDTVVQDPRRGLYDATELRFFDVSEPTAPSEVRVDTLAGRLVDARFIDYTAHLATTTLPGPFKFVYPTSNEQGEIEQAEMDRAAASNRRVIRESTIEQWVPPGVPCERVTHPRDGALFSTVSLWSIPINEPAAATVTGLIANAEALAATADDVVVATKRFEPEGASATGTGVVRTHVHRFALEEGGTRYLASGSVPGVLPVPRWWSSASPSLVASRAVSPRGPVIRVATTNVGARVTSASGRAQVTVLEDDGAGLLNAVGSVTGLGEAGESISAVRYLGDLAFVVTFRITDPFYIIDLSNPRRPRLRGQLKTPGLTGYLHPIAEGRLLGIGTDVDGTGHTYGTLTVYDVANLDAPQVVQRVERPDNFWALDDPHAFLLWNPTRQAVVPIDSGPSFEVYRLGSNDEIVLQGSIVHEDEGVCCHFSRRVAMIEGSIFTVSSAGVLVSDPDTLLARTWAPFPTG